MTIPQIFFLFFGVCFWIHTSKKTSELREAWNYDVLSAGETATICFFIAPMLFALGAKGWANALMTYFLGLLLVFLLTTILDWGYVILSKSDPKKRWQWIVVWFILFAGAYVLHLMTGLQYIICILGELGAYFLFEKALSMFKRKKT